MNFNNNLTQRIFSGIIGAAVILGSIYVSVWLFFIVFFIIHWLTLREFYRINCLKDSPYLLFFSIITGLLIHTLSFCIEIGLMESKYYFTVFTLFLVFYVIKLYRKELNPFDKVGTCFLGILYISLPFALFNITALQKGAYNPNFICGVFLLIWSCDTGAFLMGKCFGKHKLFESVSPNKTWEGTVGGGLFSVITGIALGYFFTQYSILQWITMGVIIAISAIYGDLIESLLKRSKQVKDSGRSIPGHGGFLDRFDSFLFAAPILTAFLNLTA